MERTPTTKDKYIGLEIEFSSPISQYDLERILVNNKLWKYCDIDHDGRAEPGHISSLELKVLMKQKEINTIVPSIFKILNDIKAKTNDSHGIHVHLDMRKRNAAKAYNNLVKSQDVLFKMAHPSRIDNTYCIPNVTANLEPVKVSKPTCYKKDYYEEYPTCSCFNCYKYFIYERELDNNYDDNDGHPKSHYSAISDARDEHDTLEVRIRESTLDGDDVLNWIKTLIRISDGRKLNKQVKTMSALAESLKLSSELKKYIQTRVTKKKKAA